MLESLASKALARLDRKDIGDGRGNTFFVRYTVAKTRWFSVYLHQFFRSDAERCLHDHPWPFVSIILRGGYWEEMFRPNSPVEFATNRHWRRPGSVLRRTAETSHRIVLEPGTKPWSLVIVGRKVRDWGFWTPTGWWKWRPGGTPICEDGEEAPLA
jgi:hypothetical protein